VAELEASAIALASLVAPLTDCTLVGSRIKYRSAFEAPVPASGDTPIAHAGVLFFRDDVGDTSGIVIIPAMNDSALVDAGPGLGLVIDLTNSDVSSLVTAVLDGGVCNPFGVPFVDVLNGYIQSRV
jgi:hypothetical protein